MKKTIAILIAILIGCGVEGFAQGKVSRNKDKTVQSVQKNKKKDSHISIDKLIADADRCFDELKYDQAFPLYKQLVDLGKNEYAARLAFMIKRGLGTIQDPDEYIKYQTIAASMGNESDQYYLGESYYEGKCVNLDYEKAFYWIKMASDNGYIQAQEKLGEIYYYGNGVSKDYVEALNLFKKTAVNYGVSNYYLGLMYEQGQGIFKDYHKSLRYYCIAGIRGCESAIDRMILLVDILPEFKIESDSLILSVKSFAEKGNPKAQSLLGTFHYSLNFPSKST